jgi:hypothetical protein
VGSHRGGVSITLADLAFFYVEAYVRLLDRYRLKIGRVY